MNFAAALTATDITFVFRNDPSFTALGNVSVTDMTHASGNFIMNGGFESGLANWRHHMSNVPMEANKAVRRRAAERTRNQVKEVGQGGEAWKKAESDQGGEARQEGRRQTRDGSQQTRRPS